MMKIFLIIPLLLSWNFTQAQHDIEWDGKYKLQLSDFRSPATLIGSSNIYSLHTMTSFDFGFHMSNAEFMFTKNFNSKVNCTFKPEASSLVAPDSVIALDLLNFARFEFDLAELYARKFRKKIYEEKGAFSDVNFFRPIHDEIQNEYIQRHTMAARQTDMGRNSYTLQQLHKDVLDEIEVLNDFCKTCKPPKKK